MEFEYINWYKHDAVCCILYMHNRYVKDVTENCILVSLEMEEFVQDKKKNLTSEHLKMINCN